VFCTKGQLYFLAAPRKVVRRQAETAKPVGDKNGKVNQEEDKKADGAEEADERIRNSKSL